MIPNYNPEILRDAEIYSINYIDKEYPVLIEKLREDIKKNKNTGEVLKN